MLIGRRSAIAALSVVAAAAMLPADRASAQSGGFLGFVDHALEKVVIPNFVALDGAAGELSLDLDRLCAAPAEPALAEAKAAFEETVLAWAGVMTMPIEPLDTEIRRERFFFWPDQRGVTLRQVQPVLAARDETVLDPAALASRSVAIQGLGALEFLLYGTGWESILEGTEDGRFRCAYAMAVGRNLAGMAGDLKTETDLSGTFVERLTHPGADNPLYASEDASLVDLIVTAEDNLERARDGFLLPTLGLSIEFARPHAAPLWRSGLSLRFLSALVESTNSLVEDGGLAEILPDGSAWILDSFEAELAALRAEMPALDASIDLAASDEEFRRRLFAVGAHTENIKGLISLTVPRVLNLSAAFFANEG